MSVPEKVVADECERLEESCLYSAVTLFEFMKAMRFWRFVFVVGPIIASGIATSALIQGIDVLTGICVLIAGVFPAIYKALKFDVSLAQISKAANKFMGLRDQLRQLRLVGHQEPEKRLAKLTDQLDAVRESAPAAPERFFKLAKQKIESGHYSYEVDKARP